MPDRAFREYGVTSASVMAILALESAYRDPPDEQELRAVEGLRGGAAVLMVAAFERYLHDAISEAMDRINSADPPCDFGKLPPDLQTSSVYNSLEIALRGNYDSAGNSRFDRLPDVFLAVTRAHNGQLDSYAMAQTGGNPNSTRVKKIYKSVGMSNVLATTKRSFDAFWGQPTASTFVPDTLDSVVNRRHVVAHTASTLSLTRVDLASGQRFLTTLIGVLDSALDRHVDRIITGAH